MARTLPGPITAALAATGAQPSIALTSQDLMVRPALLQTFAAPGRSAALRSAASSLIRADIPSGADPQPVHVYRITDPSQFGQWSAAPTATLSANGHAAAGVALAQTGATIRCFWIDRTSLQLFFADSTNDGATWGAATLARAAPGAPYVECTGLAAASTTDVFSAWYAFPQAASVLFRSQFAAGVWSAWTSTGPSSPTWGQLRGISIDPQSATRSLLAGVQMRAQKSGLAVASSTLNGAAWTPFVNVQPMDTPGNGLSHPYPTVHWDPASSSYLAVADLVDDGSISANPQTRVTLWQSADQLTWTLLQSLWASFQLEVHAMAFAGATYVFDASQVYQAPAPSAAANLAADLVALHIRERPNEPATFTLTLSNNAGQYTAQPQLKDNATVALQLGYNGTTIATHLAYIDALALSAGGRRQTATIHARSLQKLLDLTNPVLAALTSPTIATAVKLVATRADVPIAALPGTSQFSQVIPSFSVLPGQTWLQALKRLAAIFQFDATTNSTGTQLKIAERSAADASTWTYGQEHLGLSWQQNSDQPNVVRVVGAPTASTQVFAEVTDQANLHASGAHRYLHIVDRLLTSAAQCLLKAQLALRDAQTQRATGSITVSLNPTHELLDVITITDPNAGLAGQKARINAIDTHVDWDSGQWFQILGLETP